MIGDSTEVGNSRLCHQGSAPVCTRISSAHRYRTLSNLNVISSLSRYGESENLMDWKRQFVATSLHTDHGNGRRAGRLRVLKVA